MVLLIAYRRSTADYREVNTHRGKLVKPRFLNQTTTNKLSNKHGIYKRSI